MIAIDVDERTLEVLPFDVSDTSGPVGVTTRADAEVPPSTRFLIDAIQRVANLAET